LQKWSGNDGVTDVADEQMVLVQILIRSMGYIRYPIRCQLIDARTIYLCTKFNQTNVRLEDDTS
jgi:hypothetical protein